MKFSDIKVPHRIKGSNHGYYMGNKVESFRTNIGKNSGKVVYIRSRRDGIRGFELHPGDDMNVWRRPSGRSRDYWNLGPDDYVLFDKTIVLDDDLFKL